MSDLCEKLAEKTGNNVIFFSPPPIFNEEEDEGVVTMQEARTACRIDGTDNDDIIRPLKRAAEWYVLDAVGESYRNDPRTKEAILTRIAITYRPERDAQGILREHVESLLLQMGKSM